MLRKLIVPIVILLLFTTCNDDFDVNADWKDITIVYGLLSVNEADSIHYIRINRAFLNEKTSAIAVAKESDSINYTDTLDVILIEYRNGNFVKSINLYPEYNYDKDSGMFAYDQQILYRTDAGVALNPKSIYELEIRKPGSKEVIRSSTTIVDNIEPVFPRQSQNISFNPSSDLQLRWYDGVNAYFYDVTMIITYYEFKKGSTNINEKELVWNLATSYRGNNDVDEVDEITITLEGQRFYDYLASQIEEDLTLERSIKNIKFVFSAGGEEIFNYINVNQPSIGTIQKKPEYSNIQNGYGVFSSRNQNTVTCRISNFTKEELQKNDATRDLNFTL